MYMCLGVRWWVVGDGSQASSMMCLGSGGQEGSLTVPLSSASLSPCPGFDITPNYVDSSPTGIVVSPWCSCRGSGNMEEECEKFLKDFTENPCLRESACVRPVRSRPAPPVPGDLELCWVLPAFPLRWLVVPMGLLQEGVDCADWGVCTPADASWSCPEAPGGLSLCHIKAEGFWSVILMVSPGSFGDCPVPKLMRVSASVTSAFKD